MNHRAILCYRAGPRPVRPTRSLRQLRVPRQLTCRRTGGPVQVATRSSETVTPSPFKTHFDHVRDRRSDAEGEALLAEALARRAAINRRADPYDSTCGTLS
jgi:hypothetical protein